MRVLSIHRGLDTAGSNIHLKYAFDRAPDVEYRSCVRRPIWANWPTDAPWEQAPELWRWADVVQVHNSLGTWQRMGGDKPFVIYHHGTQYRKHHAVYDKAVAEHGGVAFVSTHDMLAYGENITWLPLPRQIDKLAALRKPVKSRMLRVGHAPTRREVKSTEVFLRACAKVGVEPVVVERTDWWTCQQIKGSCDAYFDQVKLGYGCNAVEAWAMGLPVIAGADDVTLARMRREFGSLPFMRATEATIADALAAMKDEATRAEWGQRGHDHAVRWHDGAETVARLLPIYERLAA